MIIKIQIKDRIWVILNFSLVTSQTFVKKWSEELLTVSNR